MCVVLRYVECYNNFSSVVVIICYNLPRLLGTRLVKKIDRILPVFLFFLAVVIFSFQAATAAGDAYTLQRALVSSSAVRIRVADEGTVKITYEQLRALGWPGLSAPLSGYQLYHDQTALPLWAVESGTPDEQLQSGEYLVFYASPGLNRYRQTDAYWLGIAASGSRMPTRSAPPSGSDLSFHLARRKFEYDAPGLYIPSFKVLPGEIGDRFFWGTAYDYSAFGMGNVPFAVRFDLPGYFASGQDPEGEIEIVARGGQESASLSPDHQLDVTLNGRALRSLTSEDKQEMRGAQPLAGGTLLASGNALSLAVNLHPGLPFDTIYIDRFYVTYPRAFRAVGGQLDFFSPADGPVTVNDVDGPTALVLEINAGAPTLLTALARTATAVRFQTVSGRHYVVSSGAAPAALALPKALPRMLADASAVEVPYLILHPDGWERALSPLISLYRDAGLTAVAVAVESIYDIYGAGNAQPQAIQGFLAELKGRSPALQDLLLVGDATYDPFDLTERGEKDWLPTIFVDTDYFETASDVAYADLAGDGGYAFHVGRVPAKNREEVEAWVEKRCQSEVLWQGGKGLSDLLFVSDDPDSSGAPNPFRAFHERLLSYPPARFSPEHLILPEGPLAGSPEIEAFRRQLLDLWARPNLLISYAGHGAASFWAQEQILRSADVPNLLAPSGWPTVLAWNCLNGYFVNPYEPSLAEKMLLTPGAGAVAMLASSGLSALGSQQKVAEEFFRLLFQGESETLGELFDRARMKVVGSPADEVVARLATLFGDPGMKLAMAVKPQPPLPTPTPQPPADSGGCGSLPGSSAAFLGLLLALFLTAARRRPAR